MLKTPVVFLPAGFFLFNKKFKRLVMLFHVSRINTLFLMKMADFAGILSEIHLGQERH